MAYLWGIKTNNLFHCFFFATNMPRKCDLVLLGILCFEKRWRDMMAVQQLIKIRAISIGYPCRL